MTKNKSWGAFSITFAIGLICIHVALAIIDGPGVMTWIGIIAALFALASGVSLMVKED